MIEISQLRVCRDEKTVCQVEQLSVGTGEHLTVVGSNGSGKTTLLRVLSGLTNDFSGCCTIEASLRERTLVHQHPYLFRRTVLANTRYGQRSRAGQDKTALAWLEQLGVAELAKRSTKNLSGGEIRRVALARALACQPRLLILDEPFAELDPQATALVCQVLNSLSDTTIVTTSPTLPPATLNTQQFLLDQS